MGHPRARRHYRVAQRDEQQMQVLEKGIFITKDKKRKLIAFAIGMFVLVFIKGMIWGYLMARNEE